MRVLDARDSEQHFLFERSYSCEKSGMPISDIRVCTKIGGDVLKLYGNKPSGYQGVKMIGLETLQSEIEFFRFRSAR